MTREPIDVEHRELVPYDTQTTAVVLWGSNDPREMTARMGAIADALADVVRARGMTSLIGPKNGPKREYVRAEGWAMVGAMVGVFARTTALDELRDEGGMFGFRASVELVTRDGGIVGGAVAICTRGEALWEDREWNQIASMAQTRAQAKAYRGTFGFIMPLVGFAPTPAEEMEGIHDDRDDERAVRSSRAAVSDGAPRSFPNVGALLTAAFTDLQMDRPGVMRAAGLAANDAAVKLAEYPGGLDALWAKLKGEQEPERAAPAPLDVEVAAQPPLEVPVTYRRAEEAMNRCTEETGLSVVEIYRLLAVANLAELDARIEAGQTIDELVTLAKMAAAQPAPVQ